MPPMFIDTDDMKNTYGEKEMIELTDRNKPRTGTINEDVMTANINDAEAEIIVELSTAFDISAIRQVYQAEKTIPIIDHWAKVVTRLHLYSSLENDDSQVTKAYDDYKVEIAKVIKSGTLVDSDGNEIKRKSVFAFVEETDTCCYDYCGYHRDHL